MIGSASSPRIVGFARQTGASVAMLEAMLPHLREFTALRSVTSGGDAIPATLARAFHAHAPAGCALFNMYGPSETTCIVSSYACTPEEVSATVPIGKPIPNVRFYVLDPQLNLVPPGVNGELLIGGNCLARGYLKQPELTAEKFIANPFSSDPDEKLCEQFDVILQKKLYGREVRGIERSTFVIDREGRIAKAWRGVKVPGHAEDVLAFVKTI